MKKRIILPALIASIFATAVGALASTLAWFNEKNKFSPDTHLGGASNGAYFGGGDGSSSDPFLIKTPRHLYNLAWLQYIGYFNRDEKNNSTGEADHDGDGIIDKQYYFQLSNDIDMTGWKIPPIGTSLYPFVGNFDGNNCTVSNLMTTNRYQDYNKVPSSVKSTGSVSNVDIVGFFGVVGTLEATGNSITSDNQTYTYSTSIVSLEDFTLTTFEAKSYSANTLIGLAAGYINGTLSNSKVGSSTISVNGCKPITSITNNLSDYSLVGFTRSTSVVSDFTKKISENFNTSVSGGNIGGFGASVNFKDYNDWFYYLHSHKSYDTGNKASDIGFATTINPGSSYTKHYNIKTGTNYKLVNRTTDPSQISDPDCSFAISYLKTPSNGQYLNYSFDFNSDYTGTYREYDYTSSSVVYSQDFTWSENNNDGTTNKRYTVTFTTAVSRYGNQKSLDLKCTATSGGDCVYFKPYAVGSSKSPYIDSSFYIGDNHVIHLTNDTYIPLKFTDDDKTAVSSSNTGYITGTSLVSDSNYVGIASPRISSYSSSYLSGSMSNGVISTVKTYDGGEWKTITETKDSDGKVTEISNVNFTSGRYIAARNVLAGAVEGKYAVHGIHFDVHASNTYSSGKYRGSVDANEYVEQSMLLKSYSGTAKTTRIPKGCIDFELEDKGYITFFAGFYNSSDTATSLNFFSLHHVIRTSPTAYTLKEIKKIYKSSTWTADNPDYVYEYNTSPATYSSGTISGSAIFDLSTTLWPARTKDNSIYYFEIPVLEGEYVMGAVDKTNSGNTAYQGAYMMYLDIGSNGKSAGDTTMDAQYIQTSSTSNSVPSGIDFDITGLTTVGGNSTFLRMTYSDLANMTATVTGSLSFVVNARVVADATITGVQCMYDRGGVLDKTGSTQTIADQTSTSGNGYRTILASIVASSGEEWELEYQEILDGSGNITSSSYVSILKDGVDVKAAVAAGTETVPAVFLDNLTNIKNTAEATRLVYHGEDFKVNSVSYSGTTVSITTTNLGSTALTVTYPSGNYDSLSIDGTPYSSS